jgi:hypothetical protein
LALIKNEDAINRLIKKISIEYIDLFINPDI